MFIVTLNDALESYFRHLLLNNSCLHPLRQPGHLSYSQLKASDEHSKALAHEKVLFRHCNWDLGFIVSVKVIIKEIIRKTSYQSREVFLPKIGRSDQANRRPHAA